MRLAERMGHIPRNLSGVRLDDGLLLDLCLTDDLDKQIYFNTIDLEVKYAIKKYLHRDQIAIDVGANIGLFSLLMGKTVGSCGTVYSYEPNPTIFARLQNHIAKNMLGGIIHATEIAISDASGMTPLFLYEGYHGLSSLAPDLNWRLSTINVKTVTLDTLFASGSVRHPHFIKIDAEGAELLVLRGAEETVCKARPVIVAEISLPQQSRFGYSPEDLWEWASTHEYSCRFLHKYKGLLEIPIDEVNKLPEGNILLRPAEMASGDL
jgi:FkbM family methyltransferase